MKQRTLLLLLLALVLAVPPLAARGPAAAQGDGWRVESAMPLDSAGYPLNRIFTGPDGHHIAAQDENALCVVDMVTEDSTCIDIPPESRLNGPPREYYGPLAWSKDAAQIALVGSPFIYLVDTDLSVLDVAEGSLTTLADDGVEGRIGINDVPNLIIDSAPAWSPDGTQIAVERTMANAAGEIKSAAITLVDAATGDARRLAGIPGLTPGDRDWGTVVNMDWSPDAGTLAFTTRHASVQPLADGLWTVDVESGEPELLLSLGAALDPFRTVFADADEVFLISPVVWSPDGSRLLFWMGDPGSYTGGGMWAFWMDVETHEIQALPQPFAVEDDDPRFLFPVFATWSPDGSQILAAWRLLLTPPGNDVMSLDPANDKVEVALQVFDVESGSSTIPGYLPQLPAFRYTASWGEDGDALIAGYYLKLAQE